MKRARCGDKRVPFLADLKSMFDRLKTTVILVTHDQVEAARLGDLHVVFAS